ncbi:hypothetical protein BVY03_02825 [bacterium K02(2017)]|nr:hypothetical protein BVY03_02825 [bacterium K02(2017)]
MPKLELLDAEIDYSPKIIMVDDEEAHFLTTQASFKHANFENELIYLRSGYELMDYLLKKGEHAEDGHSNPLLILLDLYMPGFNGNQVIETILQNTQLPPQRISLLTTAKKEHVKSIGLKKMPYMKKPLTFDKLYQFIVASKQFEIK